MDPPSITTIPIPGINGRKATPRGICYSYSRDALLFTDAHRIRCVYPVTERRKSALRGALTSVLVESDALPVAALISIIHAYAMPESTSTAILHLLITLLRFVCSLFGGLISESGDTLWFGRGFRTGQMFR